MAVGGATKEDDKLNNPSEDNYNRTFNQLRDGTNLSELENNAGAQSAAPQYTDNNTPQGSIRDGEQNNAWTNNVTPPGSGAAPSGKKEPLSLKGLSKRYGPISIIIAILFGSGSLIGVLFSPSLFVIHFKELILNKLNDQLSVMEEQNVALLKKKFTGYGAINGCTKLSIRCKFNTMSDRQLKKLEKAGIKVNTTGTTLIKGRHKIENFEFKGEKITADTLRTKLDQNVEFRSAMRKGYNPKLAGYADATFGKLANRLSLRKDANLKGTKTEELKESLVDAASGAAGAEADAKVTSTEETCSSGDDCKDGKRTVYKDANGTTITQDEYNKRIGTNEAFQKELDTRKSLTNTGEVAAKSTLKGVLTATAFGLGAVDSACTGYNLIRAVGFAAKYLGMVQLIRYSQALVLNTADSAKALQASPEAMAYAGTVLTTPNIEGTSASGSYGFNYVAYGDAPRMTRGEDIPAVSVSEDGGVELGEEGKRKAIVADETTKYINGQAVSDGILGTIIGFAKVVGSVSAADDTCGFVKSGWGQTIVIGTAIVGAAVAFFSGGASLGWGAAAQASVSVGISLALAMMTPKLYDMAAGKLINGDENGNQAGNAAVSGGEGLSFMTAQARGIPALNKKDAMAYQERTNTILAQYAEEDRLTHSPFDVTNTNTFMGRVALNLLPYTTKTASIGSGMLGMLDLTKASFASIVPKAKAAVGNEFEVCQDRDQKELIEGGIATRPFCTPVSGMNEKTLNKDPEAVVDYMENNGYIEKDSETGLPKEGDNDYGVFIQNCVDRPVPLGGFTEDNPDKGEMCIQGASEPAEEEKLENFRAFHSLVSVDQGHTEGYAGESGGAAELGKVVSPVAPGHVLTSGYGPRGSVGGAGAATSWHAAIDLVSSPPDVFAAMDGEVVSVQGSGVNVVTIKHADGLKTRYLHMYPKDVTVKAGDKVTAGQKIGKIGCAGQTSNPATSQCSGDHLDFNIWIDEVTDRSKYSKYQTAPPEAGNSAGKAINPALFLKDYGVPGFNGASSDI